MRRENVNRVTTNNALTNVRATGYHAVRNDYSDSESYAISGFRDNLYFTSDRTIKLTSEWKRPDDKPLKGFGLEVEVECWHVNNSQTLTLIIENLVFNKLPKNLFKYQADGSLSAGSSSIECITQIMTKEFIRNHYSDFKYAWDVAFPLFGISASRSGNCGMHCNISNKVIGGDNEIRKLYYIVNRYFKTMCACFSRNPSNTYYCGAMNWDIDYVKSMDLSDFGSNHYCSFNLGHYDSGRVELRLVGGQPNFDAFKTTMETIFFLVDKVKTLSWNECQDIKKVFDGCNQYVCKGLQKANEIHALSTENYEAIVNNCIVVDF